MQKHRNLRSVRAFMNAQRIPAAISVGHRMADCRLTVRHHIAVLTRTMSAMQSILELPEAGHAAVKKRNARASSVPVDADRN